MALCCTLQLLVAHRHNSSRAELLDPFYLLPHMVEVQLAVAQDGLMPFILFLRDVFSLS